MKSYRELIEQTFEFPQKEFKVRDHELLFNDVPLMDIIKQYGTPLKITYLPRISENIRYVQATFQSAMERFRPLIGAARIVVARLRRPLARPRRMGQAPRLRAPRSSLVLFPQLLDLIIDERRENETDAESENGSEHETDHAVHDLFHKTLR